MSAGPKWTEEQLSTLRRMYADHSPQEVAVAVRRPLKSVYCKAHEEGLKTTAPSKTGRKAAPKLLASKPCMPVSRPAPAYARGPAMLPGPPIITAKTRFVVGPSPQRTLRTSTFQE